MLTVVVNVYYKDISIIIIITTDCLIKAVLDYDPAIG